MIYTRSGDKGKTSVLNRKRILKNSQVIKTLGVLDETNSYLGTIKSICDTQNTICDKIENIQKDLFLIGAIIAGESFHQKGISSNLADRVKEMEMEIDRLEGKLPVQMNFIIPGGTKIASELFFARTLVRRAEREIVGLRKQFKFKKDILIYINRLSDYLFILARWENHKEKIKELYWKE